MTTVDPEADIAAPTLSPAPTARAYFLGQSLDLRAIAQQRQIQAPLPALLIQHKEDEDEMRDRHSALEHKLDLLRQQTGLRLEWYVVLLIVIEVLLSLYDLFIRPR